MIRAATAVVRTVERRRSSATRVEDERNFLLLQHHRALGPAVLATAIIPTLRAVVPGARIIAGADGFSFDVLNGNPGLEQVLRLPDPRKNLRGAIRALRAAKLFGGKPYTLLQTIGTSRLEVRVAAMFSGARRSLGYVMSTSSQTGLAYDLVLTRIANDFRLIESLGHKAALVRELRANPELEEPQLFVAQQDLDRVGALLREQGMDPAKPLAVFVTRSRPDPVREWPEANFREVAAWLHETRGMQIVFAGMASQRDAVERVRAPLPFLSANLAGLTSVMEMAALLSFADVGVMVDTGAIHLGRAVKLPMVIFAAAAAAPIEWLPLGSASARIFYNPFWREEYDHPPQVRVAEVLPQLEDLLKKYPAMTRTRPVGLSRG